jgi:uncharacterized protein (TIGR03435 family)
MTDRATLRLVLVVAFMIACVIRPAAQDSPGFEAATLKINKSGDTQIRFDVLPRSGRINVVNVPMRTLINAGFRIRAEQLINAPAWVDRTRVDLIAKVDPSLTTTQIQDLLVPLLQDLAKFRFHRETRDFDVYVLTVAKPGVLGPNLKQASTACDAQANTALNQSSQAQTRPDGTAACGPVPGGPGHVIVHGFTMDAFSAWMTGLRMADRPVVDGTGLTGGWDADVKYTPDALSAASLAARGPNLPPGLAALATQVDPNGPTLRQALQDQLGLKFEPKRLPREVVVVDQLEVPEQ